MGRNKKPFIDKKNAQKFSVVHRSQRDPLQADVDSSSQVLVQQHASQGKNNEENLKYGIYYNDDYDYMQHLRQCQDGEIISDATIYYQEQLPGKTDKEMLTFGNLQLPSEAFPSTYEENEGMLSKGILPRGPQPDWDPDVVAALDDDVDFDDPDNFLDDDFIVKANGIEKNMCIEPGQYVTESIESDEAVDSDYLLSDEEWSNDDNEETKSRFTNYSMTSSVMRRNEGLKTLDDRFERIMEEYDEDKIGCYDTEEVTGELNINNNLVTQVIDEFLENQRQYDLSEVKNSDGNSVGVENVYDTDENKETVDDQLFQQFECAPKEKWDCESIISTYSNLYNHPKYIVEEKKQKKISLDKHTGLPLGVFNEKKTVESVTPATQTVYLNNIRNKNETKEERKIRKHEIKQQRKARREEKKNNKLVFKDEFTKQKKINMSIESQKGIKL